MYYYMAQRNKEHSYESIVHKKREIRQKNRSEAVGQLIVTNGVTGSCENKSQLMATRREHLD